MINGRDYIACEIACGAIRRKPVALPENMLFQAESGDYEARLAIVKAFVASLREIGIPKSSYKI